MPRSSDVCQTGRICTGDSLFPPRCVFCHSPLALCIPAKLEINEKPACNNHYSSRLATRYEHCILFSLLSAMTDKEENPVWRSWPSWFPPAQQGGYAAREPSSATHSWEPAAGEAKRARSESPAEDGPNAKRMRIRIADASADQIEKSGNAVGNSAKWVLQDDPCGTSSHAGYVACGREVLRLLLRC